MKKLFLTFINLLVLPLVFNINLANAEVVPVACTANNEICDAAFICNYWYRAAFEPNPTDVNEQIFGDLVNSDGNAKVRQSCTWQVGFVSLAGSPIYDR